MTSKTAMLALVKDFRAAEVDAALAQSPALKEWRDERGRNWLHICCGRKPKRGQEPASIETVRVLLKHGFDLNQHAFTEGTWRATPVWYAIGRGANLALAEFLLKRGADPNHSLWAASFRRDRAAIRLLVRHGAEVDEHLRGQTPFLGAVAWSLFGPAEELLELGADPNVRDADGRTALHLMLKKNSDKKHFAMLLRHGARGDIPDKDGNAAADIMARKRDPGFRKMAEQLRAARG